jgi:conjugative transposon TraM protein
MTQQKKDNTAQKQQLKKYLIFAAMFLAFGICMWWIFTPSGSDKEAGEQGTGFNADIPDPKDAGIIGDKQTAYEQEQARLKQEEKMRSLEDFSFIQDENPEQSGIASGEADEEEQSGNAYQGSSHGYSSREVSPFESSNAAYKDINRTLGNFYEEPKEDTEKEALREEVERLKAAMAERGQAPTSYDDQVALLEKSYELAAKYMPGGKEGTTAMGKAGAESGGTSERKTDVAPVSHVKKPVVSSLGQPVSDLEFVKQFSEPRNYTFHTATSEEVSKEKNTIKAVVHEDQTLVNGQSVRLRVTEPMQAGGQLIPRNTILTGVGRILGERMEIRVSSIEHEGNIIPVSLQAYDLDGQQGIYIPGSMEMAAVKEIAGNMGQNLGSTINISQQGAGEQLFTDLGRGAIQGASQYISKKAREVKVTLKAGYRIFLLPGQE